MSRTRSLPGYFARARRGRRYLTRSFTERLKRYREAAGYEIAIRPLTEAEGGGFGATVPQLPGCMADGETPQEALEAVYDAILCWMEAAEEMGRPVPEPKHVRAA